ncbi:response regulator transcription factor [Anaerotardibacter muris]|uniref:response regulator transcription factor n=1 Tax=Anaerotardibacter muris TaxID=2941505 RepID=UPI00203CF728|nr:response regulator transcription factor [Anaerotardibacter muris]
MARVLVADDDAAIVGLVKAVLEPEGFEVTGAASGREAIDALDREAFDLVILDVMMPGIDGFETCRQIRQRSNVPIIFLSAKDEEADKVVGFTLGGDDYVTKPFKPRELVARVKARLRRSNDARSDGLLSAARGIEIDSRAHTATLHDVDLKLTPKEFDILTLLVRAGGRPVSTEELFEDVWKEPYRASDANTIMVHIRRLRMKLAAVDSSQTFIETVFGVGYKIETEATGTDEHSV